MKPATSSINAANISSILPNASLVDTLTDTKITGTDVTQPTKPTSSPMAPSEVSPNTAICDRPKVKSVSKKDCKNNRRLAAAASAFQSTSTVSCYLFVITFVSLIYAELFVIRRALIQHFRYPQQAKHLQLYHFKPKLSSHHHNRQW